MKIMHAFIIVMMIPLVGCLDFSRLDCFDRPEGCSEASSSPNDTTSQVQPTDWVIDQGEPVNADQQVGSSDSCEPNVPLSLCSVCNEQNEAIMPEEDENCASITCPAEYVRDINDIGQPVCLERAEQSIKSCASLGVCHTRDSYVCMRNEEVAEIPLPSNECIRWEGCVGSRPPQRVILTGQPCRDGQGSCNEEGECGSALAARNIENCMSFSNEVDEVCEDDWANLICKFEIDLGAQNCQSRCAQLGGNCIDANNRRLARTCNEGSLWSAGEFIGINSCEISNAVAICECSFSL